jgi:hypothetical protein
LTLKYFAPNFITGTFSDFATTIWTNLASGWQFFATDILRQYYWNGTKWLLMHAASTLPSGLRKSGWFPAASTANGIGLFTGNITNVTTPAAFNLDVDGFIERYTSTGASGDNAGIRVTLNLVTRAQNPYFWCKFRSTVTTNRRIAIGFMPFTPDFTGDDPLNAVNGVMLCSRATETNWQIAFNEGVGVTNFEDTGVATTTGFQEIHIFGDNANTRWLYKVGTLTGTAWTILNTATPTTNTPAATTQMGIQVEVETAEAATKIIDIYGVELDTA